VLQVATVGFEGVVGGPALRGEHLEEGVHVL
jgi:hypothetical protein